MSDVESVASLGAGSRATVTDSMVRVDLHTAAGRDNERLIRPILAAATLFSGLIVGLVIVFVVWRSIPAWHAEGLKFLTRDGWDTQLENAWNSSDSWPFFGAWPLLAGTILTTLGAVIVSTFIGVGAAVFIAEIAPGWLRRPIETIVQLLAGVPSVVFGLVGLAVIVPYIANHWVPGNSGDVLTDVSLDGTCLLAAVAVLSFMILPFFVTVAVDSLRAVPRSYLDGGLALGMTRWRTITRIQIPTAMPGLLAGIMLAAARAIGEAIAISMVGGSLAYVPNLVHGPLYFLLEPLRTMASAIVDTGSDAADVPAIAAALFALASVLLVFSLTLSLLARWVFTAYNRRLNVDTGRHV